MRPRPAPLTPLEIAAGRPFGEDPAADPLPDVDRALTPLAALEEAVLPMLARPPCLVSFSGGRDSAAVLAVAARVARREGLPLPIPVSASFRHAPGANEPAWQEEIVRHLDLADWKRVQVDDDLDLVGPLATRTLRRHGLAFPWHAHLFALLLEGFEGGSLLTGYQGDPVLGGWRHGNLVDVVSGRARVRLSDLLVLGYSTLPATARRVVARRRASTPPWLRPAARPEARRLWGRDLERPARFNRYLEWLARRRTWSITVQTLSDVAADAGAVACHPLGEPRFLAALARMGGRMGSGGRGTLTRRLFADLLPGRVVDRPDKAVYHFVYVRDGSRAFARAWDGSGVDPGLVDPEALRATWLARVVDGRSIPLLQQAWLAASARSEVAQPVEDGREHVEPRRAAELERGDRG